MRDAVCIRQSAQFAVCGKRLFLIHIQHRTDSPPLQFGDQGFLIDHRAARRVNQERSVRHHAKQPFVYQMVIGLCHSAMQGNDFAGSEDFLQRCDLKPVFLLHLLGQVRLFQHLELQPERLSHPEQVSGGHAEADDSDRLIQQSFPDLPVFIPTAVSGPFQIIRNFPECRQRIRDDRLRNRFRIHLVSADDADSAVIRRVRHDRRHRTAGMRDQPQPVCTRKNGLVKQRRPPTGQRNVHTVQSVAQLLRRPVAAQCVVFHLRHRFQTVTYLLRKKAFANHTLRCGHQ